MPLALILTSNWKASIDTSYTGSPPSGPGSPYSPVPTNEEEDTRADSHFVTVEMQETSPASSPEQESRRHVYTMTREISAPNPNPNPNPNRRPVYAMAREISARVKQGINAIEEEDMSHSKGGGVFVSPRSNRSMSVGRGALHGVELEASCSSESNGVFANVAIDIESGDVALDVRAGILSPSIPTEIPDRMVASPSVPTEIPEIPESPGTNSEYVTEWACDICGIEFATFEEACACEEKCEAMGGGTQV